MKKREIAINKVKEIVEFYKKQWYWELKKWTFKIPSRYEVYQWECIMSTELIEELTKVWLDIVKEDIISRNKDVIGRVINIDYLKGYNFLDI